jgi:hypothetical protein
MRGRFPNQPTHDDYEDVQSPALTRLLFLAIGIALLLGLICGVVWTVYHLLGLHFLG